MNESCGSIQAVRRNERGAARLKFIIVLVVVALVGYMGFQYIPVAYQSYTFKKYMDTSVLNEAASTRAADQKGAWVENQLRASSKDYGVPPDAKFSHMFQNGQLEVTVKFTRPINLLPGFTYQYNFDHTAKSDPLLNAPQ
jgi:PKD repeat protein